MGLGSPTRAPIHFGRMAPGDRSLVGVVGAVVALLLLCCVVVFFLRDGGKEGGREGGRKEGGREGRYN